jgi:hypothetical protein
MFSCSRHVDFEGKQQKKEEEEDDDSFSLNCYYSYSVRITMIESKILFSLSLSSFLSCCFIVICFLAHPNIRRAHTHTLGNSINFYDPVLLFVGME